VLSFAKSKKARCVEGDPGEGIKMFYVSVDVRVVLTSFSLKSEITSLHVALPFTHLNCCAFLLLADSLFNFQSLKRTAFQFYLLLHISSIDWLTFHIHMKNKKAERRSRKFQRFSSGKAFSSNVRPM